MSCLIFTGFDDLPNSLFVHSSVRALIFRLEPIKHINPKPKPSTPNPKPYSRFTGASAAKSLRLWGQVCYPRPEEHGTSTLLVIKAFRV